jgi:hypothetical protein
MSSLKTIFILLLFFVFNSLKAQYCGTVALTPNTSINQLLTFNSLTDYIAGITINNAAQLRVIVTDQAIPDPLCSWNLTIVADNGGTAPATEWEELYSYSLGASAKAPISLLEIRVRNSCGTSLINGNWQPFPLGTHNDILEIIRPLVVTPPPPPGTIIPAGSPCPSEVNGPGDYISNYAQYNFNIDIRVVPTFAFNPAVYQLNLRFILQENNP